MNKRASIAVLMVTMLVSMLFVSGCGQSSSNQQNGGTKATTETKTPIKIGFTAPLTGPYNDFGIQAKNGLEVAIKEWNDKGGINGRQVQLITRDDGLDPNKAQLNTKELIEVEKVDALIGPLGSSSTMAVLPLVVAKNIPFMAVNAQNPAVVYPNGTDKPPSKNVFSFAMQSDVEAQVLADFVSQNWKKIGLLAESTAMGSAGQDFNTKRLKEKWDITPVASEKYNQKDTSMTAQLAKLQKAGAEVVVLNGLGADVATIKKDMNRLQFNVPLVGAAAIFSAAYEEMMGNQVVGTVADGLNAFVKSPPERTAAKLLADDYLKMFGNDRFYGPKESPKVFFYGVGFAYDAMNVLLEGIKRAGKTDAAAVIAELEKFTNYSGALVDYTFSPTVHNAVKPENFTMLTYVLDKDGKPIIVPYSK